MRQKFTGYQKDEETGLDFAEARMYENRHARFTAVDPLLASGKSANPQTFNRYVYVMDNPLKHTDPTGLQVGMDNNLVKKCRGNCFGRYNPNTKTAYPYDPVASVEVRISPMQNFLDNFSHAYNDSTTGLLRGGANFGINSFNSATQPFGPIGGLTGVPNPFAIEPYQFDNERQASWGSRTEVGLNLGLIFAGGAFSGGASSLSVVPESTAFEANVVTKTSNFITLKPLTSEGEYNLAIGLQQNGGLQRFAGATNSKTYVDFFGKGAQFNPELFKDLATGAKNIYVNTGNGFSFRNFRQWIGEGKPIRKNMVTNWEIDFVNKTHPNKIRYFNYLGEQ